MCRAPTAGRASRLFIPLFLPLDQLCLQRVDSNVCQMTEGRRCQVHLLDDRKLELLVQDATMTPLRAARWKRSLIELMGSLISHPLSAFDPNGLFIKVLGSPADSPKSFQGYRWEGSCLIQGPPNLATLRLLTPTVNPHKAPPTFDPLDWEKIAGTQPEVSDQFLGICGLLASCSDLGCPKSQEADSSKVPANSLSRVNLQPQTFSGMESCQADSFQAQCCPRKSLARSL
ncbi:FERM domain-containing protein 4A, partial [Ophiophagus hannah]